MFHASHRLLNVGAEERSDNRLYHIDEAKTPPAAHQLTERFAIMAPDARRALFLRKGLLCQ